MKKQTFFKSIIVIISVSFAASISSCKKEQSATEIQKNRISDIIPQKYSYYFKFNPLYHFLYIIRNVLHQGCAPEFYHSIFCLVITFITVLISIFIYRKTKNGFISNL